MRWVMRILRRVERELYPEFTRNWIIDKKTVFDCLPDNLRYKDVFFTHPTYETIDESDLRKFAHVDVLDERKYVPDDWECEHYTKVFVGRMANYYPQAAFGQAWIHQEDGNHLMCWFINSKMKFRLFEPQNDTIRGLREDEQIYRIIA